MIKKTIKVKCMCIFSVIILLSTISFVPICGEDKNSVSKDYQNALDNILSLKDKARQSDNLDKTIHEYETKLSDKVKNLNTSFIQDNREESSSKDFLKGNEITALKKKLADYKLAKNEIDMTVKEISKADNLASKYSDLKNYSNLNLNYRGDYRVIWPVVGYLQITSPYGQRGKEFHSGIDIGTKSENSPIVSIDNGVVTFAGDSNDGFGNKVIVDYGSGFQVLYAHMSKVTSALGHIVKKGDQLGFTGHSGNSDGNHLHMQVTKTGKIYSETIDPSTLYYRAGL